MNRAVNDLAGVLEKQIANYRDLKTLVLEERKVIITNDLKRLADVTARIQALIASNNQLEMGRVSLVKRIAAELNLSGAKPTLADIANRLEKPLSDRLLSLRRQALEGISEMQRQNRINSEMLKYCANLMDSALKCLVAAEPREVVYGRTGEPKRGTASVSLLDRHV
jgi:flagellar biosynthesis/type III secretory pathway chaperone